MAPSTRFALLSRWWGWAGSVPLVPVPGIAQDVPGPPPGDPRAVDSALRLPEPGEPPGAGLHPQRQRPGAADPRVFVSSRDGWRLVQLAGRAAQHGLGLRRPARATRSGGSPRGARGVLQLVSSGNDGRTWKVRGILQKISKAAVVDLFSMNDEGRGTLILRLDADASPNAPRLGYYVYISKNGGKSWSEAHLLAGQAHPAAQPPGAPRPHLRGPRSRLDAAAWQRLLADLQPAG